MSNSKGFVVKSIKNGETSMIVSCYLEDIGLESFIVKGVYGTKNNKFTKAHFFPLNFISIDYSISKTGRLGYIKEVKPLKLYKSLHSFTKITFFTRASILYKSFHPLQKF